MLERVSGSFQFMPLAAVLNDPAEQARACPCRECYPARTPLKSVTTSSSRS